MSLIRSDIPVPALLKRFALIYLPIVAVLSLALLLVIRLDKQRRVEEIELQEKSHIEVGRGVVMGDLSTISTNLRVIANMPLLHEYLDSGNPAQQEELENFFLVLAQETQRYDQIRYLDASGQEVIRINYNDGKPAIIPREQLQNKSGRYYFSETFKLNQSEIFVSPLDLNVENEQLEIPYKPMIRFATPVFNSAGLKKGILVFNYLGNKLIQRFRMAMQGHDSSGGSMLLNHDGYWVSGPQPQDEWGFMLGRKERTFGHDFPEAWRAISAAEQGSLLTDQGLFVYSTVYPLLPGQRSVIVGSALENASSRQEVKGKDYQWKIVSFVPPAVLAGAAFYNQARGRIGMGISYLLLALGAWIIALLSLKGKQAEAAQRKSEQRLAFALQASHLGEWDLDLVDHTSYHTLELNRIFGYEALLPQWTYEMFLEHVLPEDRLEVDRTFKQAVATQSDWNFECRIRRADGELRWVWAAGGHQRDSQGAVRRMAGVVQDITERKQANEYLRVFAELIDIAPVSITIHDPDGKYLYVNQTACDLHGYAKEELLALNIHDLDIPEDERLIASRMKQILETGTGSFEISHYRKDRSIVPLHLLVKTTEWDEKKVILSVASDITERKGAEDVLRESEERLRLIAENIAEVFWMSDVEIDKMFYISPAYEQIWGRSLQNLYENPRSFIEAIHPVDKMRVLANLEVQKSGQPFDHEYRIRRPDGTIRWIWDRGFPIHEPTGEVLRYVGVAQDITVSKEAEGKISEYQQFLQHSLDALTHPFYVIDANDYTIKLSNKASHFDEYREGTKCFQLTHNRIEPCAGDEHPCTLREIKKTRQPVVVEHIHTDQAGMKQSVEIHAYPIFDSNSNLSQVIEYCLDTSERKKGEEERRRLVTAIEQSVDSVVITDKDGMIQYVNPSFEKITGYSREEVIGRNPRILQSGRHDALFYQEMWRTLTSGKAWQGHLINRKKDATLFEEEVSITPVLNEAGEIINYVAVKRDVTEQMQLEEQLQQAQKMEAMGTLAGGIAHDFNNILSAILGYSEFVKKALPPGTAAREDIDQVINSGKRATALVQQILDFSRKTEQKLQPLRPHLVLEEVLQMLRSTLPTSIEIQADIDPACGTIMADP
ncbi:MAG: PAS domain S-box protein, partial [Proteobacteria bacterium]|nr:PAS domain S-box protein [Pseudomonadota bacterium]